MKQLNFKSINEITVDAIENLSGDVCWGIEHSEDGTGNITYGMIQWQDNNIAFTEEEFNNEVARLQAEYDNTQYARDRATQYAPLADQLDMLWHAIDQGIDLKQSDFYTGNKAVKDAHPKG